MTRHSRLAAAGSLLLVLSCIVPGSVQAFGARLTRPWERESSTAALAKSSLYPTNSRHKHNHKRRGVDILFLVRRPECSFYTAGFTGGTAMRTKGSDSDDDDEAVPPAIDTTGTTPAYASSVSASTDGALHIVSAATKPSTSTSVWSKTNMGPLFQLVRPANFPGIVLFHMMGVYLALLSGIQAPLSGPTMMNWTLYWNILLKAPTMWLVLAALMLTSSTSMVVNDYYDAKLGRDDPVASSAVNGDDNDVNGDVNEMINSHPLAQGRVSLPTARRFLSYLYGAALVTLACLPGVHVRLSVVFGLILTYFYTQSLKPVTWVKNVVCASLIALSPLTSGMAALTVIQQHTPQAGGGGGGGGMVWTAATGMILPRLWRLTATLFFGILGREIMMDCNDVENDGRAGVLTVPVVHGRRFASGIAFGTTLIMAGLTVGLELLEIGTTPRTGTILDSIQRPAARRLALASIASALTLRQSWQVFRTQGSDSKAVDKAVNESLVTVAVLLASFV